ncbi:MAG: WecB/TagA/CpsF family glycosyltransferase [Tissierellales bacterium]|nr:WecB/TagA/CpsF family glycosyltransferase [Tissierellales bacterium]
MNKVDIFGIQVENTTLDEVIEDLEDALLNKRKTIVFTPNTEIVMMAKKDEKLKKLINTANHVIPDGIGLIYGAKIKGITLKQRVTGYDTSIRLLEIANKYGLGLYLLGGKDGVSKDAFANILKKYPNIRLSGYHHGYFNGAHTGDENSLEEIKIIEDINRSNPDILFVGFGFPKQEIWIDKNKEKLNTTILIGNGGVIDVLSGRVNRAPDIFIKLNLEWLYRLIKNPSRIKRQVYLPLFLIQVILDKNSICELN